MKIFLTEVLRLLNNQSQNDTCKIEEVKCNANWFSMYIEHQNNSKAYFSGSDRETVLELIKQHLTNHPAA